MGRASREVPKRLGEKLLLIRTALGLSQDGMLRRLSLDEDYGRHYISGFETGEREPSLLVLLKYSAIAKVWINVLVDDDLDLPNDVPGHQMSSGLKCRRTKSSSTKKRRRY